MKKKQTQSKNATHNTHRIKDLEKKITKINKDLSKIATPKSNIEKINKISMKIKRNAWFTNSKTERKEHTIQNIR